MSDLTRKFQMKAEMKGGAFRCPKDVALPVPNLTNLKRKNLDYVIVFVRSAAEIEQHAAAAAKVLREDGLLWFCYPKKTSAIKTDIHRDTGWQPVMELGFEGCRMIAIDDTWSSIRFREPRFSKKG